MLLPQSKKSQQAELPPLETPEQRRRAEEQDRALTTRAKRRQAEAAADRDRFELTRDKVLFGFELALAVTMVVAAAIVLFLNPELIPLALLSGSGVGGLTAFLKRGKPES